VIRTSREWRGTSETLLSRIAVPARQAVSAMYLPLPESYHTPQGWTTPGLDYCRTTVVLDKFTCFLTIVGVQCKVRDEKAGASTTHPPRASLHLFGGRLTTTRILILPREALGEMSLSNVVASLLYYRLAMCLREHGKLTENRPIGKKKRLPTGATRGDRCARDRSRLAEEWESEC
jgi:hypothetical protein